MYRKLLLFLPALLLAACAPSVRTCSYAEATELVNTPATMYRGTDYLGSDADFHYFEYKMELGSDTRFRIARADYTIPDTFPYSPLFPERRDTSDNFRR